MAKQVKVLVACKNCKRNLPMQRALKKREPLRGVYEIGIDCPHCHHWQHHFYETPAMRALQPVANTPEAKADYKELYDSEQERIKAELEPAICFPTG